MFSLNSSFKMALASSDLLCSGGILNALFLSAIYVSGSNHVTHGQLFCKEISDVNISLALRCMVHALALVMKSGIRMGIQ